MARWQDAVSEAQGAVRLELEVTAGARQARFPDGYNPWRNRIGIRVRAAAQHGAANAEVVALAAATLGVEAAQVRIVSGERDSRKAIAVHGASLEQVLRALGAVLDRP